MKKTLFWTTMLICFGIYIAQAEWKWPFETKDANEGKHVISDIQPMAYVDSPPHFIFPVELGFGVAVGIPYDLFFISDTYYLYKDNVWYVGGSYLGSWVIINFESLPSALRQYKIVKVRALRDREYLRFQEQKENYRGKHFRPAPIAERREIKD